MLLGASNLTRSFDTAVHASWLALGGPLTVLAAHGHGRSLGLASRVLGRRLESLLDCGLWEALPRGGSPRAVLMDVGNDLVYGVAVEQVLRWVEEVLRRLEGAAASTVLIALPMRSLVQFSPRRIRLVKRVLFPSRRVDPRRILWQARELQDGMAGLAASMGCTLIQPERSWYGWDAIHVRRAAFTDLWRKVVEAWTSSEHAALVEPGIAGAPRLPRLRPARRWMWGIEQRRAQPSLKLSDGTELSLY